MPHHPRAEEGDNESIGHLLAQDCTRLAREPEAKLLYSCEAFAHASRMVRHA
jgi:hypothetical protein